MNKKAVGELIDEADKNELSELVDYYSEIKDYKKLEELYQLLLKRNPHDYAALKELAIFYADMEKDYEKAKKYFELALSISDADSAIHVYYGSLLEFNFQEYELSKAHYLKAIELDPQNVEAYINLSWLYLERLDDVNTSYIVVQEALKYVEDSEIYAQMAYIEMMKYKEYEKANNHLDIALHLDKGNDLAYMYLGQLYIIEKKYDEAKKIFSRALYEGAVNDLSVYEYTKLLIMEFNDIPEAIKVLEKAIEIYPDNVIFYAYIANLHFGLGNYNEARRYLSLAENFEINDQIALLLVGYLKVLLDDNKDDALLYFEKVIELNPTNLNALSFIGFYNLINNQEIDTALDYFKKIADLSKDNYIIHFIIAQIYLQHYADSTEALEYLLKINMNVLNDTEKSHLLYIIGNVYEKYVNNNHMALDYYEKAYRVKPSKFLEEVINNIYESDKTIVN